MAKLEESGGSNVSGSNKLKLYSYWLSSCSFRVRIALNLKGLKYDYVGVPSTKDGNLDPVLFDMITMHTQYLDEAYPQHPLLPRDLQKKAINYQAANIVSSNIQPLQNLSVTKIIEEKLGPDEKHSWVQYHIRKGFTALEKLLKDHAGRYATGDEVFLADLFLAPQLHTAITVSNVDMSPFPLLLRLHEAYGELEAFQKALPQNQPDASNQQH